MLIAFRYYAAQPTTSTFNEYEITEPMSHYVEIEATQLADISTAPLDESAETDKDSENQIEVDDYDLPHDYIDVF